MKLAIWAYTVAVTVASLSIALLGNLFENIYHRLLGNKPMPELTHCIVGFHWWPLLFPLPWVAAAIILSRRQAATPDQALAFAAVSTLAITFLFALTAISLPLPFFSFLVCLEN